MITFGNVPFNNTSIENLAHSNKTKSSSTQASNYSISSLMTGKGIPVNAVENVTYKFTPVSIDDNAPESIKQMLNSSAHKSIQATYNMTFNQQWDEVQKHRAELEADGMQKNTQDIIFVNGKALVKVSQDGGIQSTNALAGLVNQYGEDLHQGNSDEFIAKLKEKYGPDVRIESFEKGQGPTNADVFNLLNDSISYEQYIDQEIVSMNKEVFTAQLNKEEMDKQQAAFNNVPQQAVFKVNDEIVGTLDVTGKLNIMSMNVIKASDDAGLDRDNLGDYFNSPFGTEHDVKSVNAMLQDVFADDVNITEFSTADAPTLGEVNAQASEQFNSQFNKLIELIK